MKIDERVDRTPLNGRRRTYGNLFARKGLRASITCDEGERSSLLDSFTGRKSCRQVAEEAQDQRCNVGVTRSPVVFSWHLRGTNRQDLCGCFSGGPISRLGFTSLSESVWTRGSKDVAFSGTGHSSVTPAARNARLSRMELQHPPWQRWRVGIVIPQRFIETLRPEWTTRLGMYAAYSHSKFAVRQERLMLDPILRMSEVVAVTGLSRSTIYRRMAEGQFPRSVKLGKGRVGWRESEVQEWLESLPRAAG